MCPIDDAVDVGGQYIWEIYNDSIKSYENVTELSPWAERQYQQFEYDHIHTRLVFTPYQSGKLKFKCTMPANNEFNRTVWIIESNISGSNEHGQYKNLYIIILMLLKKDFACEAFVHLCFLTLV